MVCNVFKNKEWQQELQNIRLIYKVNTVKSMLWLKYSIINAELQLYS